MGPMFWAWLWTAGAFPPPPCDPPPGWLHFRPKVHAGSICASQVEAYVPQPGDIILFDAGGLIWNLLDVLALTWPPDHSGIVIVRPDGRLALLEAAPDSHLRVYVLDLAARLHTFKGRIWVRRLNCPLTPEQSASLTDFALAQEGKRYALLRFAQQITPFRARGKLRGQLFGRTYFDRKSWICSEIVAAALAYIGLVDPNAMPANIVYPRDLLDNRYYDLRRWDEAALWSSIPGCRHKVK